MRASKRVRPEELGEDFEAGEVPIPATVDEHLLDAIGNANSQKEYYLTDAVAVARSRGLAVSAAIAAEDEVLGVNDRAQLAAADARRGGPADELLSVSDRDCR